MLKKLPQINETLIPNSVVTTEIIEYINSYIQSNSCENLKIDISFINIIDSCHIVTLCSTNHYIKYPQGKVKWITSSSLIKDLTESLRLENCEFITA